MLLRYGVKVVCRSVVISGCLSQSLIYWLPFDVPFAFVSSWDRSLFPEGTIADVSSEQILVIWSDSNPIHDLGW